MSVFTWAIRALGWNPATYAQEVCSGFDGVMNQSAEDMTTTVARDEPSLSGNMIQHTSTKKVGENTYQTVVDTPYASFVNDGTRHMAPRYFAEHAVAEVTPRALDRLTQNIEGHGIR